MRFALVIVALTACWHGYVEPEPPQKPRRVVKTRPQCWTKRFYEEWPRVLDYYEVYSQCRADWEWTGPEQIDACVATRYHYAYDDWTAWTMRWWESCAGR